MTVFCVDWFNRPGLHPLGVIVLQNKSPAKIKKKGEIVGYSMRFPENIWWGEGSRITAENKSCECGIEDSLVDKTLREGIIFWLEWFNKWLLGPWLYTVLW